MQSVFLDFATISRGDIDVESLSKTLPDLQYFPTTKLAELHQRVRTAEIVLTNKIRIDRETIAAAPKLKLICLVAMAARKNHERCAGVANHRQIPLRVPTSPLADTLGMC